MRVTMLWRYIIAINAHKGTSVVAVDVIAASLADADKSAWSFNGICYWYKESFVCCLTGHFGVFVTVCCLCAGHMTCKTEKEKMIIYRANSASCRTIHLAAPTRGHGLINIPLAVKILNNSIRLAALPPPLSRLKSRPSDVWIHNLCNRIL